MRAALALIGGLFGSFLPTLAHAAPFDLEWSAPPGCPSRESMIAATRAHLGETDTGAPPDLFVRGTVSVEKGPFFVVAFHMTDAEGKSLGERRVPIREATCAGIEAPASLVLAMMITVARPTEVPAPAAPSSSSPPPSSPPPSSPPPSSPPPDRPPPRARRLSTSGTVRRRPLGEGPTLSLAVSGVTSLGFFPNVGIGGAVRSMAVFASGLVVGIETSFETSRPQRAGTAGEATLSLVDGGLLSGFRLVRSGPFEVIPLIEVRGGVLTASATGFPRVRNLERLLGVVAIGALSRISLSSSFRLEILPDLRVPLKRDELQVRREMDLVHVHQPSVVEARLSIGIGLELR